jgi:MFS family permease
LDSVVLGVIAGMIVVGYLANSIGRRKGSILTASLMGGGAVGLFLVTFISSPVWLYRWMSALLFVFGLGVGGEYPLSASSASEKAMQQLLRKQNTAMDELGRLHQEMMREEANEEASSGASDLSSKSGRAQRVSEQRRGRQIQLVFSMQGMGIWFNSFILMCLLFVTGQTGKNEYNHKVLMNIWRLTYFIGAAILVFVLVTRYLYLAESQVWADDRQRQEQQQLAKSCATQLGSRPNYPPKATAAPATNLPPAILTNCSSVSSLSNPTIAHDEYDDRILKPVPSTEPEEDLQASPAYLLMRNYGVRLFGASTSWLLWDISFYGNKLFQATFLLALTGEETTLLEFAMAATLNSTVALLGYFGAALLVDDPRVGRLRLQAAGFLVTGCLFVLCGFSFGQLSSGWLVTFYLASSFFGQLGPNATTFLIPAEIFPTEMRTLCHGICAASGKVGALVAAVLFNLLKRDVDLFLMCGYASFLACFITIWTIPETAGMDLLETDRKWRMTLEGRKKDYTGAANHPNHLSMYERWKIGLQF